MSRPLKKDKDFENQNLTDLVREYDFKNRPELLLCIDELNAGTGADLVVYDTSTMLEQPESVEDFKSIINENALDEEIFEIERTTFVQISDL